MSFPLASRDWDRDPQSPPGDAFSYHRKMPLADNPKLSRALHDWWRDGVEHDGRARTAKRLLGEIYAFLRDSTPERRRQRYGDAEYDWDFRVNTMSAGVGWRDRLLGHFHSAYQPTEPLLFREMLDSLKIDYRQFTFLDLGSGKGRTLLMASDYPFRRIVGVELLPELHRIAKENIRQYKSATQKCSVLELVCADARDFVFPLEPTVLYLFNPFLESALATVVANLDLSLRDHPRPVYVLYLNPVLEEVVAGCLLLKKIGGTHQYSVFAAVLGRLLRIEE